MGLDPWPFQTEAVSQEAFTHCIRMAMAQKLDIEIKVSLRVRIIGGHSSNELVDDACFDHKADHIPHLFQRST